MNASLLCFPSLGIIIEKFWHRRDLICIIVMHVTFQEKPNLKCQIRGNGWVVKRFTLMFILSCGMTSENTDMSPVHSTYFVLKFDEDFNTMPMRFLCLYLSIGN